MTWRIVFFSLIIFFCSSNAFAQKQGKQLIDSLLTELTNTRKDDTDKVNLLNEISYSYRAFNYDTSFLYSKQGLQLAQSLKWEKGTAISYYYLGICYYRKAQYPEALDNYFKALRLFEEINAAKQSAEVNSSIGIIFQYMNKFDDAVKYETKSLKIYEEKGDKSGIAAQLGDIGTLYWLRGEIDTALVFNFKSLDIYTELGEEKQIARTNGNIGMMYENAGNYATALEYDFKALTIQDKIGDRRSAGINYGNIGTAYWKIAVDTVKIEANAFIPKGRTNLLHKALDYADSGMAVYIEMGDLYDLQDETKDLATIEALLGNYKSAYESYKQYVILRDSFFSTENKIKIAKAEAKHEIQLAQLALAKKQNERWFFICVIFLLSAIGILLINWQRIKQKKLEGEKVHAENELEGFKKSIYEKNLIIERVTEEIERLKKGNEQQADNELITQLEQSIILTDEQWEKFRVLFGKVYKNFFVNLKKKIPDLTQAEVRLLALTKLKLSSKEMAAMMGISPSTIRIYRHRLRRKLNLDKEELIEELVENI